MKRLIYLSLAALMVMAVSCNKNNKPDPAPKVPEEAVDLGIEMTRGDGTTYKLYWAKSNLSKDGLCTNPEDYGDCYCWGETSLKEEYSWPTYQFGISSIGPFSKYNTSSLYGPVDNKTVLDPEDDVAYVKLNGQWRMPTDEEWNALMNECDWTWTTQNGVNGRLVKSKTNGNSIFLPAAGYRIDTDLDDVGSHGFYWSSSLDTDYPYGAWCVYFESNGVRRERFHRRYGHPVRPVCEE